MAALFKGLDISEIIERLGAGLGADIKKLFAHVHIHHASGGNVIASGVEKLQQAISDHEVDRTAYGLPSSGLEAPRTVAELDSAKPAFQSSFDEVATLKAKDALTLTEMSAKATPANAARDAARGRDVAAIDPDKLSGAEQEAYSDIVTRLTASSTSLHGGELKGSGYMTSEGGVLTGDSDDITQPKRLVSTKLGGVLASTPDQLPPTVTENVMDRKSIVGKTVLTEDGMVQWTTSVSMTMPGDNLGVGGQLTHRCNGSLFQLARYHIREASGTFTTTQQHTAALAVVPNFETDQAGHLVMSSEPTNIDLQYVRWGTILSPEISALPLNFNSFAASGAIPYNVAGPVDAQRFAGLPLMDGKMTCPLLQDSTTTTQIAVGTHTPCCVVPIPISMVGGTFPPEDFDNRLEINLPGRFARRETDAVASGPSDVFTLILGGGTYDNVYRSERLTQPGFKVAVQTQMVGAAGDPVIMEPSVPNPLTQAMDVSIIVSTEITVPQQWFQTSPFESVDTPASPITSTLERTHTVKIYLWMENLTAGTGHLEVIDLNQLAAVSNQMPPGFTPPRGVTKTTFSMGPGTNSAVINCRRRMPAGLIKVTPVAFTDEMYGNGRIGTDTDWPAAGAPAEPVMEANFLNWNAQLGRLLDSFTTVQAGIDVNEWAGGVINCGCKVTAEVQVSARPGQTHVQEKVGLFETLGGGITHGSVDKALDAYYMPVTSHSGPLSFINQLKDTTGHLTMAVVENAAHFADMKKNLELRQDLADRSGDGSWTIVKPIQPTANHLRMFPQGSSSDTGVTHQLGKLSEAQYAYGAITALNANPWLMEISDLDAARSSVSPLKDWITALDNLRMVCGPALNVKLMSESMGWGTTPFDSASPTEGLSGCLHAPIATYMITERQFEDTFYLLRKIYEASNRAQLPQSDIAGLISPTI